MDYGLNPAHYYTLPGITFDECLIFTQQELDLFTDSEKFLFIENSIRGAISVVSHRHAKAKIILSFSITITTPPLLSHLFWFY